MAQTKEKLRLLRKKYKLGEFRTGYKSMKSKGKRSRRVTKRRTSTVPVSDLGFML